MNQTNTPSRNKVFIYFIREIYLINNLRARILISNNIIKPKNIIIKPKNIIINIIKKLIYINSYNIIININIR